MIKILSEIINLNRSWQLKINTFMSSFFSFFKGLVLFCWHFGTSNRIYILNWNLLHKRKYQGFGETNNAQIGHQKRRTNQDHLICALSSFRDHKKKGLSTVKETCDGLETESIYMPSKTPIQNPLLGTCKL